MVELIEIIYPTINYIHAPFKIHWNKHARSHLFSGRCLHDRKVVGFITTYMQSVSITTNFVSSNSAHGVVYSIKHYAITFVIDLLLVGGFLRALPRYSWNIVESGFKNHNSNPPHFFTHFWLLGQLYTRAISVIKYSDYPFGTFKLFLCPYFANKNYYYEFYYSWSFLFCNIDQRRM